MEIDVVLSTIGKFHLFDLARELNSRGLLQRIFTGYPRARLRAENLPRQRIATFPLMHAPYMALRGARGRLPSSLLAHWEYYDRLAFDRFVANRIGQAHVVMSMSGVGSATGMRAKRQGSNFICDRGSTHILFQDRVLREEHAEFGLPYSGIDTRVVERELFEYQTADRITVPSNFVRETFVAEGVPVGKIEVIPYGVDLQKFRPTGEPGSDTFDILFAGTASVRKGVQYLIDAFLRFEHPHKSLTFAGIFPTWLREALQSRGLWSDQIRVLGHLPQADLTRVMSRSRVLVLPSLEEGLALVLAQAMAAGCPVIATPNSGVSEIVTDPSSGIIVPPRSGDSILEALTALADDHDLRVSMRSAALAAVESIGGWQRYGSRVADLCRAMAT